MQIHIHGKTKFCSNRYGLIINSPLNFSDPGVEKERLNDLHKVMLKNLYKERLKSHNPFYFFLPFTFDMADSCVPLTLYCKTTQENVNDLDQFVKKAFKKFKLAVLIGNPFNGKTTLAQKIAFDWANIDRFKDYHFVFHSEIRSIVNGTYYSIFKFALAGIRDADFLEKTDLTDKRILILLDGYDEKRQQQVCDKLDQLLNSDDVFEFNEKGCVMHLLVTCRPSKVILREKNASFWNIEGFVSPIERSNYIQKHFRELRSQDDIDKAEAEVTAKLSDNLVLTELVKSPMMMTFFCIAHKYMKQVSQHRF